MTPQEIIDALKAYVINRVYDNDNFEVDGTDLQDSYIETIDVLFSLIGGTQDLQSVLDNGSVASIAANLDVTSNGNNFTFGGGSFAHSWAAGLSSVNSGMSPAGFVFTSEGGTDINANASITPNGILFDTDNSNAGDNKVKLKVEKGSTIIGSENYTISSITDKGGVSPSDPLTPQIHTATWDIGGDLKVRALGDGSADTQVLTVDVNGLVNKRDADTGLYTSIYNDALVGETTVPIHRNGYGTTGAGTAIIKLPANFSTDDGFTFSCAAVNASSVVEIRDSSDALKRTLTSGQSLSLTKTYGGWFVQEKL